MENREYLIHFDHVLQFDEEPDEEAWYRILDSFIDIVAKEGGSASGGMHELGTIHTCCKEGVTVCQECLEDISSD